MAIMCARPTRQSSALRLQRTSSFKVDRSTTLQALAGSCRQPPTFVDQIRTAAASLIPPFGPRPRRSEEASSFRATDFALQTSGCTANSVSGALQVLDSSRLESAGAAATTWPGHRQSSLVLTRAAVPDATVVRLDRRAPAFRTLAATTPSRLFRSGFCRRPADVARSSGSFVPAPPDSD